MHYLLLMTLKKVGESFSFLSSSHRVNPLEEFVSDCSNSWAPKLSTACSLFSPSSLMPYNRRKIKIRKRKRAHTHIVIPVPKTCPIWRKALGYLDHTSLKAFPANAMTLTMVPLLSDAQTTFQPVPSPFPLIRQTKHQAPMQVSPHIHSKDSNMRDKLWRSDWVHQGSDSCPWKITSHIL